MMIYLKLLEKPEEEYKNQDTLVGGAAEKAVTDHGR